MFDLKMIQPGLYEAQARYGYVVRVERDQFDYWVGSIIDPQGNEVTDVRERTKRAAYAKIWSIANGVHVERTNALNGNPVQVSITTPVVCDPSMEAYFTA